MVEADTTRPSRTGIDRDFEPWPGTAQLAGLDRTDKSCWERWNNHLKPGVNKENFSEEEDDIIICIQWAFMAKNHLPRRTANAIKNRWNNHLKKMLAIIGDLERYLLTDEETSDHSDRNQGSKSRSIPVRLGRVVSASTMAGNIGVEMVEKMRGKKPTKMKNTDYRDGLHLVVAGRIPKFLPEMELNHMRRRRDETEPHEEEAESPESSTAVIDGERR
ncbi:transcription factor MYB10-like [Vitis riparia]|uniref:transcription factor MYB10-like n=1 Tax=Vitis riparia TaxID=96939 RepID=UPI00155A2CEC|nr:transcription factor MYB10-like [Vitis riparia]